MAYRHKKTGMLKPQQPKKADPTRDEGLVFADLAALCASPGFAHTIAAFCFRDNMMGFGDKLSSEAMAHMFTQTRLIRTEISTLIGLMARHPLDLTHPGATCVQEYSDRAEALLHELHLGMSGKWFAGLTAEKVADPNFNPFANAETLREPIFYSGESAYSFQYRDLAIPKYQADDDWLRATKGFDIATARRVVEAVGKIQARKVFDQLKGLRGVEPAEWTLLPGFLLTDVEVAAEARLPEGAVAPVLQAFALPPDDRNPTFQSVQDYNSTNAAPLLPAGSGQYLLFQHYSLVEALYEGPFYWMGSDKAYQNTAFSNRGDFTETVARDFMRRVFGQARVHTNVLLPTRKGATRGEIDVLVLFGDQAIVIQAKAKRLTLEARKGNDQVLKDDFNKAIQDACDQAADCSAALLEPGCSLVGADGTDIALNTKITRVFPICLVADHYPALNFQARQFLKFETAAGVASPLISDVFALDVMTEMLSSPLRFFSYLILRDRFASKMLFTHEINLLGYHLKNNLWLSDEHHLVALHDDFAIDLDIAMIVRREGQPGERTPPGILTRLKGLSAERLLAWIDANPDPATMAFGLFLLEVDEDTFRQISLAIDRIVALAANDGMHHDATVAVGGGGVTLHANALPDMEAREKLGAHCRLRKYTQRAEVWFGVVFRPASGVLRFGMTINEPWKQDADMDRISAGLPVGRRVTKGLPPFSRGKIGRNDLCPCGSGIKFKKCHLR
ncbi:MAG: prepilin peptidase [Alphaproteobacteria bacterium PA2]|nr:MAG: prepilin peptidase [Alphaproteobacteria bacterium PA2]